MEHFVSFWNKPCFYCGKEISTIGIDRVDNTKGYSVDNLVPCCTDCNKAKNALSQEQFLQMARAIVKTHGVGEKQ